MVGGYEYSLALRNDGTVWAWGDNYEGQLGDGTSTDRSTPVQVTGLTDATAIAAGSWHSLAVRADGTVWAWGDNYFGQLGDGTVIERWTPVQVTSLCRVAAIEGGERHSLFLALPTPRGDLDFSSAVDAADFAVFLGAFGRSAGGAGFRADCDFDADGMITLADYQVWLGYYREFIGSPSAEPPMGEAGDVNADGRVDLTDFAALQECVPAPAERAFPCVAQFDFDGSGAVDLLDYHAFTAQLSGP
jgi:hypothetical protein